MSTNIFLSIKQFDPKQSISQTNFIQKTVWLYKILVKEKLFLLSKILFEPKYFWAKKIVGPENFRWKQFLGQKNLDPNENLDPKRFGSLRKFWSKKSKAKKLQIQKIKRLKIKAPKHYLVRIGAVIAEIFLIWTNVTRTNDTWTNVTVIVGIC